MGCFGDGLLMGCFGDGLNAPVFDELVVFIFLLLLTASLQRYLSRLEKVKECLFTDYKLVTRRKETPTTPTLYCRAHCTIIYVCGIL